MELTHEQISEFILKATSSSDGFNQLIEVILNSLMQHERRMFLNETSDSGNGFRPRRFCYGHYEFRLKVPHKKRGVLMEELKEIFPMEQKGISVINNTNLHFPQSYAKSRQDGGRDFGNLCF